ncbi:hypothetical protein DK389_16255 [Methylobacterium durans]|uniref:Uncharacterized protein n=1 Tax=Methylobacterium durans TaxID=2202825 RepID=A0A2U8W8K1_9HYPH|nr:hypothetical protein DK389_16255 [Methylobacterium durans]
MAGTTVGKPDTTSVTGFRPLASTGSGRLHATCAAKQMSRSLKGYRFVPARLLQPTALLGASPMPGLERVGRQA